MISKVLLEMFIIPLPEKHHFGKGQFCRLVQLKKVPPTHFGTCQKKCRLVMLPKNTAAMHTKKTAAAQRCVIGKCSGCNPCCLKSGSIWCLL